jgi:hypothetical protein
MAGSAVFNFHSFAWIDGLQRLVTEFFAHRCRILLRACRGRTPEGPALHDASALDLHEVVR